MNEEMKYCPVVALLGELIGECWANARGNGLNRDGYVSWGKTQEIEGALERAGFENPEEATEQLIEAARGRYLIEVEAHQEGRRRVNAAIREEKSRVLRQICRELDLS
jgi:hypothetical protein